MASPVSAPVGYVVVIKKDNEEGGRLPMTEAELIFGRCVLRPSSVCAISQSLRFFSPQHRAHRPSLRIPLCSHEEADIRIRLSTVSRRAARLSVDGAKVRTGREEKREDGRRRTTNGSLGFSP
jgi:hypothetical protein